MSDICEFRNTHNYYIMKLKILKILKITQKYLNVSFHSELLIKFTVTRISLIEKKKKRKRFSLIKLLFHKLIKIAYCKSKYRTSFVDNLLVYNIYYLEVP